MSGVLVEDNAARGEYDVPFEQAMAALDSQAGAAISAEGKDAEGTPSPNAKAETVAPAGAVAAPDEKQGRSDGQVQGEDRDPGEVPEEPAEPTAPAEFVMPSELKGIVPDTVDNAAGLAKHIKEITDKYNEERQTTEEFANFLSDNPLVYELINEMRRSGSSFGDAAPAFLGLDEGKSMPEPGSPEYRDMVRRQMEREQKIRDAKAKEEASMAMYDRAAKDAAAQRKAFREANKDITDQKWDSFLGFIRKLTQGDQETGLLPRGVYSQFWQLYTYQEAMNKAREKGKIEAANEVAAKNKGLRTPTTGDGVPHFDGGKGPSKASDDLTRLEESLRPGRIFESLA